MERLRAAIVACVDEDMGMIGELTAWTQELVDAFNEIATDHDVALIPEVL